MNSIDSGAFGKSQVPFVFRCDSRISSEGGITFKCCRRSEAESHEQREPLATGVQGLKSPLDAFWFTFVDNLCELKTKSIS